MKDKFSDLFVLPNASLLDALVTINKNSLQMAVVLDESDRLLGVVTDGDVRRTILRGASLDTTVEAIMNPKPKVAREGELRNALLRRMRRYGIHFLPKIDAENRVLDIILFPDIALHETRDNKVVIMAGGRGARLGALTNDCPKPMLRMGNKPMLEILIDLLSSFGFYDFVISVHYLEEQIMEHFGDGSKFGVSVSYLHEDSPLGTAGALGSLKLDNDEPFIVINGDVYTDLNFSVMLDSHYESGCDLTVCLREFSYQIPYGVVKTSDEGFVVGIEEKPICPYLVNAGIYVLAPPLLKLIPKGEIFQMTSLIEKLASRGGKVNSHRIDGFWLDVGRSEDLETAARFFE